MRDRGKMAARGPTSSLGARQEVLTIFLRLGCTSFGGPIAHLGYFRREFVERRKWCAEEVFAELAANLSLAPFAYTGKRFDPFHRGLGLASGVVSIAFGLFITFQVGFAGGLFTAHPHWTPFKWPHRQYRNRPRFLFGPN
jgi:hypothetical protein